ncbi:MAG: hypothetical protein IPP30_00890 [Flavobacterium sp.]|nr:hypothetical protein [Flavobacterium sp.]
MKKILSTLFLMLFLVHFSSAQKSSKKDVSPSLIDPISNCQLRYYYYPNLEAYFDTQKRIYYFKEDSEWITDEEIPEGYRGYSLYNKVYVFITDYDDEIITQFIDIHKKKYPYTKRGNMKMATNIAE